MKTHAQVQAHAKERGWKLMDTNLKLEIHGTVFWKDFLIAYTVGSFENSVIIEECWIQGINYYTLAEFIYGEEAYALEDIVREVLNMGDKEGVDPDEAFETDHADRNRDLRNEQKTTG